MHNTTHPVSAREYLGGTMQFNTLVFSDRRTPLGMMRAFRSTISGRISHAMLNDQQEASYSDAKTIVTFAPGFQLDAQAYSGMIYAWNNRGIPVFASPSLPQGFSAFRFKEHPSTLVDALTEFTQQLARARPDTQIITLGHSYGAAQQAHSWNLLTPDIQSRVRPVTYQGMLRHVGEMGCALPHSPLYPIVRDVFRGRDPFLQDAHDIMKESPSALFGFDPNDGYMDQEQQLGDISPNDSHVIVLDGAESPGHYGDNLPFATYFAEQVMKKLGSSIQP